MERKKIEAIIASNILAPSPLMGFLIFVKFLLNLCYLSIFPSLNQLPMKKIFLTLSASMLLSAAAVAANGKQTGPGDPQKPKTEKSSFGLSDGYFSFFNIFLPEAPKTDTLTVRTPRPPSNSGATPKK